MCSDVKQSRNKINNFILEYFNNIKEIQLCCIKNIMKSSLHKLFKLNNKTKSCFNN